MNFSSPMTVLILALAVCIACGGALPEAESPGDSSRNDESRGVESRGVESSSVESPAEPEAQSATSFDEPALSSSVAADGSEAPEIPRPVLYADEEVRVTTSESQCTVEWGDARITEYFRTPEVSRHLLAPGVDVLHFAGGDAHALVVRDAGSLRWLSAPYHSRFEYTQARFPGDGTARLGHTHYEPCRPSAADIERVRAAETWPDGANIGRLSWTRGRLREHTFVVTSEGLAPGTPPVAWEGASGACELRAIPNPELRIASSLFVGADDWTHPVSPGPQREVSAPLPATLEHGFVVSVSAGALRGLVLEELRVAGPDSDGENFCEGGCSISRGEVRQFHFQSSGATHVVVRSRASGETRATRPEPSMRLHDGRTRTVFRDDPNQLRVRYGQPDNTSADEVVAQVQWEHRYVNLRTPGLEQHGGPQAAQARVVSVGRRRLLYVSLSWSWDEDEGETEAYLLEEDEEHGQGMRLIPMALGVDRHSLMNPEFLPDGRIRVSRSATRECTPSGNEIRRSVAHHGGEEAFDAWVHSRAIDRIFVIADGAITPASTPWRWRGGWGRCEGWIMSACPFVDVTTNSGVVRVGEILRSVQFAPGRQTLALPAFGGPALTQEAAEQPAPLEVRLSEEKREVTYLDYVAVQLDGEERLPRSCGGAAPPAFCEADGIYERIDMGESVTLYFDVEPEHGATLVAEGYYEPF